MLSGAVEYHLHKTGTGLPDLYENLTPVERNAVITGDRPSHDRTFFWRIYSQDAVRQGKWKYYRNGERRKLFDLSVDQHEQADFSGQKPDVLERLAAEFSKWNQQMLPRNTRA